MKSEAKASIAKVVAGPVGRQSLGTAFLVSDRFALTALHVVADRARFAQGEESFFTPLELTFEGTRNSVEAHVILGCWDANHDWALLELDKPIADIVPFRLAILANDMKAEVEVFGYPIEHGSLTIGGRVRDANARYFDAEAIQIYSDDAAAGIGSPLNGLSGAPCMVGPYVIGIIRSHPIKKMDFGNIPLTTVKNGVMYACPISLPVSVCDGLLDPPRTLSAETLHRVLAREDHLSSYGNYVRALRRLASASVYELPGRALKAGVQNFVDLNAVSNESTSGSATRLVAQNLEARRVVVVEAPAGAGKTSLLYAIAAAAWGAPESIGFASSQVAVLAHLRDLARSAGDTVASRFRQAIGAIPNFAMGGAGPSSDFLVEWPEATESPLLLLLDAVDEVPEEHRADLLMWLSSLLVEYPQARMVLTTRSGSLLRNSAFTDHGGHAAGYLALEPPSRAQALEIAANWISEDTDAFIRRIEDASLQEVMETPLGISLAAAVYEADKVLPEFRAGLYQRYIDIALKNSLRKGLKEQAKLSAAQLHHILQKLAWHTTTDNVAAPEAVTMQALTQGLVELVPGLPPIGATAVAEELYRMLKTRTGILLETGEWRHETFREYLAARYLHDELEAQRLDIRDILSKHKDTRWNGVLLFLFSMWSVRVQKLEEHSLLSYRSIFEVLLGKIGAESEGRLKRFFLTIFARHAPKQTFVPTYETAAFAAEALIELGAAPRAVENHVLECLMLNKQAVEETFTNSCARAFSDRGEKERRILSRWASRPRFRKHLDPWIKAWAEELKAGISDDATGAAGLLLLCHAEDQISQLLKQPGLPGTSCVGVLQACRWWRDHPSRKQLSLEALRALRHNVEQASKELLEWTTAFLTASDPTLLGGDPNSPFLHRLSLYLALVKLEKENNVEKAAQKMASQFRSPNDLLGLREVIRIMAVAKEPLLPVEAVLESFAGPGVERQFRHDQTIPIELRHYAKWWYSVPAPHRYQNVTSRRKQFWTNCSDARETLNAGLCASDPEFLTEILESADTTEDMAGAIAKVMMKVDREKLLRFGLGDKGLLDTRIKSLEALAGEDLSEVSAREPLLALLSQKLAAEKGHTDTLRARAKLFEAMGRLEESEVDLTELLGVAPNDHDALEQRAHVLLNLDKFDEALRDINSALAFNEELGYRNYLRGRILWHINREREAIEAYDAAERAGFHQVRLYANRVSARFFLGLLEEGMADVQLLSEHDPDDAATVDWKAVFLSCLGRWEESENLVEGRKDILSGQNHWLMIRLQNAFALNKQNQFYEDLAIFDSDPWTHVLALYFERKVTGQWSQNRIDSLASALERNPDELMAFWLAVARNDQHAGKAIIHQMEATPDERGLRWILLDTSALFRPLIPYWAETLLSGAKSKLQELDDERRLKSETVAQAATDAKFTADAVPVKLSKKRTKYLFKDGMRCSLAGISSYDEEKQLCDAILENYKGKRAAVMVPLLDTGHVYIQANVVWSDGDDYPFKICAKFSRLRDEGVLANALRNRKLKVVVVTDKELITNILNHPASKNLRDIVVLEQQPLPYTKDEVVWEMHE